MLNQGHARDSYNIHQSRTLRYYAELGKIRRLLPVLSAMKVALQATVCAGVLLAALQVNYQMNGANVWLLGAVLATAVAIILLPAVSLSTAYIAKRQKVLSKKLYENGLLVRDNGVLATNEPNPKELVAGEGRSAA